MVLPKGPRLCGCGPTGLSQNPCPFNLINLNNNHHRKRKTTHISAIAQPLPSSRNAAATTTVSLDASDIARDGPPRLVSRLPSPDAPLPLAGRDSLPLMIYLPGIDGTGLAAARQFPSILRQFDLVTLVTPPSDRSEFNDIVQVVVDYLKYEVPLHSPYRPVYLLGESFGGLLAIAIAAHPEASSLIDRVVLVNPATSFEESLWPFIGPLLPQVPSQAYSALPIALAPFLGNPLNLLSAALEGTEEDASISDRLGAVVRGAVQLLSQLPLLAEILPAETLSWKLSLLQQGCREVAPLLSRVPQRVLIIVGDQDFMIHSKDECPRLKKALPRAHLRVEKGRSHSVLQEGGVDLVSILQEEGALVTRRRMSAPLKQRSTSSGFGSAVPIELPTEVELKRYAERTTGIGRRLSSPIFFSTNEKSGEIAIGLGNIPSPMNGPVLYVGNHQTLALDLGVLCEEFLSQREIMLRGLAHPVIFADSFNSSTNGSSSSDASTSSVDRSNGGGLSPFDIIPAFGQIFSGRGGGPGGPAGLFAALNPANNNNMENKRPADGRQAFKDFMVEFGAVPVSARNLIRLLQNGESVLLFPGGVREAYKKKNEDYCLFWPQRAEFVRMAAKYGATIVPFSAIGVDDSLEIILDGQELQNAPILGQFVSNRAANLPKARQGVAANAADDEPESFISPLALPKLPPKRMYFMFHKPIQTSAQDLEDRQRCEEVYRECKTQVEGGLRYLLEKRADDPYEDFGKRIVYEATRGGKQAPTFPL